MQMNNWQRFWQALKDNLLQEMKIGDIGEEIRHAIIPQTVATVQIGDFELVLTNAVTMSWIGMAVMFLIGWWLGHRPRLIPATIRQQLAETLMDLLIRLCRSSHMNEEQTEQVVPFIGTVGLFIMLTNLLSLFKIPPPAKNPAFPIAMALLTIVYIIVQSIRFVGLRGFFASLVYPKAMLLPFKLLDYVIKPLSLSLRLFGNVFGAFILMEFVYLILPVFLPGIVGIWFDLADGILQAVIFTYLTATYIGEVLESAEMSKQARQQKKSMQAASV